MAKTYDRGVTFWLKREIGVAVWAKTYDRGGMFRQKHTIGMTFFSQNITYTIAVVHFGQNIR